MALRVRVALRCKSDILGNQPIPILLKAAQGLPASLRQLLRSLPRHGQAGLVRGRVDGERHAPTQGIGLSRKGPWTMPIATTVARLHPAQRDDIADLVTRRPLPGPGLEHLGAFLFLNHHGPQTYPPGNAGLPFGPHPHRGFETVTFILDGELAHRDSAGHESIIGAGGVQWMTAGSGLVHAELSPQAFKRDGGALEILQLWVNLPARLKMSRPRYTGVQRHQIPAIPLDRGRVTVNLIAGHLEGHVGPIESLTGVFMATVAVRAGGSARFAELGGRDVLLYVVRGEVSLGGAAARVFDLVELSDGHSVQIDAATDALLLFGHAAPIDEPIVAHGPFVMNTMDEIRQAYADYRAGRFDVPA
jgi:redox-sensitive bicupin YhaK (pirin superfamily)